MTLSFIKKLKDFVEGLPPALNGRCVADLGDDAITDTGVAHDLNVRYPMAPQYQDYQLTDFISKPMCEALAPKLNMAPVQFMAFCASNYYHGGYTRMEEEILRLVMGQSIASDMQGQDGHIQDHVVGHEQRTIYNQ